VKEHACFLKEVGDAQKIRKQIMDCVETAVFKDQTPEEKQRLLSAIVVGGGPTGVEFAGELQDFFEQDLKKWVPEIKDGFHVTLVEALPNVSWDIVPDSSFNVLIDADTPVARFYPCSRNN
jgi:NADH:ubiquinone reductase (non-electrogenic)